MAPDSAIGAKAQMDFICVEPECGGEVKFNLAEISDKDFQIVCPKCHRAYSFDETLRAKLEKMVSLMTAIRDSQEILGDSAVSVNVAGGEVRIPYALLLTRLNTVITLDFGGKKVDFRFRAEPMAEKTFR